MAKKIDRENGEITEDEFYDSYIPMNTGQDEGHIYFETYGEDLVKVKKAIPNNNVWTVLDCDGKMIVSSGAWFVNRMNYIITEKPWTGEPGDIWVDFE